MLVIEGIYGYSPVIRRDIESGGVAETIVCDDLPANLDVDKQGKLVGIEVLRVTRTLPPETIDAAERH